jgi:hypothetical protein
VAFSWTDLRPVQAMAANILFNKRSLILVLPRQFGGKTELGCRLASDLISYPSSKSCLFLAKDRPSARKAAREKFNRLCDPKIFDITTTHIALKENPDSILYFTSVDRDPDRNRGGTYAFIHWTEVAFAKIEKGETMMGVYEKILLPTMSQTKGYCLLETTLKGKNEFWNLYHELQDRGVPVLHVSFSQMVEMGLVPLDVYEAEKKKYHPDVFRQEYECEWVSFVGRTYPEFDESCIAPKGAHPEPYHRILMAIDWGYRPSATCVLFAYVKDGVLIVYDEHYEREELPSITAEKIGKKVLGYMYSCVGDHDPARNQELINRGIPVANADKMDVLGARTQIKEMLYMGKLKIHPKCTNLMRDLNAAAWDNKKDGEIDYDACTWGHFDGEAALRYLVRMLSQVKEDMPKQRAIDVLETFNLRDDQ